MAERSGERFGWIGGWLGGFIWVLILAVLLLIKGRGLEATVGLAIAAAAVAWVLAGAPWKHPDTRYWKLMLPIYLLFSASIAWAVWAAEDPYLLGLNRWHALLILPLLSPFKTIGHRTWNESGPQTAG